MSSLESLSHGSASDPEVARILENKDNQNSDYSSSPKSESDFHLTPPSFELNDDYRRVTLSWKELSIYVPLQKTGIFRNRPRHRPIRRVINNSSGFVPPGTLLAIMGSSGSGKTTLMDVLAHKLSSEVCLDGEVLLNGTRFGKQIGAVSGYMYQTDLFYETLTVHEHLTFMARMKLDRRVRKWERERRVEELLTELSLQKSREVRIGVISGGEKKRLAFATEILTDPPLLFCDEPTTGLDSFSAQKLVGIMQGMAAQGKTILITIHQPSSQIFSMFDQLLLIADGRTAFMGSKEEAASFFENLGYVCPQHFNPADFYIQTLALNQLTSTARAEAQKKVKRICDSYAISPSSLSLQRNVQNEFKDLDAYHFFTSSTATSIGKTELGLQTLTSPGWFAKTFWLIWRALLESSRNPKIHLLRTLQKIVLALIIGACFFGVGFNRSQTGIQDIQGAIFLCITESTYPILYGIIHVFPLEMPIFLRENKAGLYRAEQYYVSKTISLLPGFILDPIIFTTISYWLIGLLPTVDAFLYTVVIIILCSNAAAACGCFFSVACDSISTAFAFLIPFDYVLFVAAGIFISLDSLPPFLQWVKYLSWFMYTNEAISITQWKGVSNIDCSPGVPCIQTGEDVLSSYSFSSTDFLMDVIGLTGLVVSFHLAAFLALLFKIRRK